MAFRVFRNWYTVLGCLGLWPELWFSGLGADPVEAFCLCAFGVAAMGVTGCQSMLFLECHGSPYFLSC